jgi:ubiquinone/menaquinone biosynthesis C-methylase UbiE
MHEFADKLAKGRFDEMGFHFAPQVVLWAALKLGIFPALEKGAKDSANVAAATGCSQKGVRMVLDCLAALGLLEKQKGRYRVNSLSRRHLLPSTDDYIGQLFSYSDQLMRLWLTLPEAVRTGLPTLSLIPAKERENLDLGIAEGLFQVYRGHAWRLVRALRREGYLPAEHNRPIGILDVAAGSAVWSLPFAVRSPRVEVTAIDFDPVLEVARKYARKFAVEGRYRFVEGDIRQVEFGDDRYDVALLGHICHSEGPGWSQRLIAKCFGALRKGGVLLIIDYIPDEQRKSSILPLLLALNALLGSEEGDTFTFSQYKQWLLSAGYSRVRTIRVDQHSAVIVGVKR